MPHKDKEARNAYQRARNAKVKQEALEQNPEAMAKVQAKKEQMHRLYMAKQEKYLDDRRKWREAHPGYFTEQNHKSGRYKPWEEYKAELDEKRRKKNEYMAEWSKTEAGQRCRTMRSLKEKEEVYGLTVDQYDEMYAAQKGKCLICKELKNPYGQYRMHIDHDHETGKVRGLLCGNCNSAIGLLKEEPSIFDSAKEYVVKSKLDKT